MVWQEREAEKAIMRKLQRAIKQMQVTHARVRTHTHT